MEKKPKISVIIPVYNVAKYLPQCLESIRTQTMKDIEIICVNDGSTDNSLQILKEYSERDVRFVVIDKANAGYGAAVNTGIKHAHGTYIGIVESDDFVQPDMYEKLYKAAMGSNAEVVKANIYMYQELDGKEISIPFENLKGCPYDEVFDSLNQFQIFYVSPTVWSAIYERKFLEENDIHLTETPGASYQDTSFAFKVFQSARRVCCIKDEVINYRTDNPNSSVHNSKKIYCICDEFREIEAFINQYGGENKEKLLKIAQHVKYISYSWNYHRLATPYQYAFLEIFEKEFQEASEQNRMDEDYWSKENWQVIQQILEDKDAFFEQTSKYQQETKRNILRDYNKRLVVRGLEFSFQMHQHIYIYGAGKIGRKTLKYLDDMGYKDKIEAFLVTNKEGNALQVDDKEVYALSEVELGNKETLVLVAVGEAFKYDIVSELKKIEGVCFFLIDEYILSAIMGETL